MKNRQLKEKYYVGISGHRDLMLSEIEKYTLKIKEKLQKIVRENEDKEVIVLSPLADGADRLMVYAAKELGLRYEVVLPMSQSLYEQDFDDASRHEFYNLMYESRCVRTIALCEGCTEENIREYGTERDAQYKGVGLEIVRRSNTIVFLWDGIDNGLTGGTADIVKHTEQSNKSYFIVECKRENKEEIIGE